MAGADLDDIAMTWAGQLGQKSNACQNLLLTVNAVA
jgi:hypothetical protein